VCTKPPPRLHGSPTAPWAGSSRILCVGHTAAPASDELLPLLTIHRPTQGKKALHEAPHIPRVSLCASPRGQPLAGLRCPTGRCAARLEGVSDVSGRFLQRQTISSCCPLPTNVSLLLQIAMLLLLFFSSRTLLQKTLILWLLLSPAGGHLSLWHNKFGANVP